MHRDTVLVVTPSGASRGGPSVRADGSPSSAQLGSSLRNCVEVARALGDRHRWQPAAGSTSAGTWQQAADSALSRTLCEAEVHAIILIRSGLEHAAATGRAVSAQHPFLPHTLGRTATEHLLRAQHLLDSDAEPGERARRRLNEWLYAITESEFRRQGVVKAGAIEPGTAGRDRDEMVAEVRERAEALGESLTATKTYGARPIVAGSEGRLSTMTLAETYTAGGAAGVPSFTMRGQSAVTHGTELGLLACSTDSDHGRRPGGINVPEPAPMDVPDLAFNLLSVVLTTVNAMEELQKRFEWPPDAKLDRRYARAQEAMTTTWSEAVNTD